MGTSANVARTVAERSFFLWVAIFLSLLLFAGFAQSYFLRAVFGFEPLSAFLHLHGLVMTLWFVLLIVQVWLVRVRRTDVHRRMGVFGGVLAAAMVGVTCVTSIRLARRHITAFPATVDWQGFLLVSFGLIFTFAGFFVLAVLWRGQSGTHKRLMVLATLSIIGPAITRLPFGFIQQPSLWPSIGLSDLCMVACVVADTVRNRRLHPAFAWGGMFLVASHPVLVALSRTAAWHQTADWLVR